MSKLPLPNFVLKRLAACLLPLSAMLAFSGNAPAQDFPQRPVRILTSEPGGSLDFIARLLAPEVGPTLGQAVIIENRGGANGAIIAQAVARATPDGYTLLLYGNALWILPLIQPAPYDPVKDFAPITTAVSTPTVLVVYPNVPIKSVKELIAYAKSKPGELNYASSATGGSAHLAAELFKSMAGVDIQRISYKGNGPAVNALLGGQVQVMFSSPAAVMPLVKSGKLRAIAATTAEPTDLLPGLPTIAASGLPGYESSTVYSFLAPAGTPAPVVGRLNRDIVQALRNPDVKQKLFNAGLEPVGNSPEQLAASMKSEIASYGKVIKAAGIHAD